MTPSALAHQPLPYIQQQRDKTIQRGTDRRKHGKIWFTTHRRQKKTTGRTPNTASTAVVLVFEWQDERMSVRPPVHPPMHACIYVCMCVCILTAEMSNNHVGVNIMRCDQLKLSPVALLQMFERCGRNEQICKKQVCAKVPQNKSQ